MVCLECGKEAEGKFCCHCGAKLRLAEDEATVLNAVEESDASGIDYDAILRKNGYSKTRAVLQLQEMMGLSLKECQELMKEPYKKYIEAHPKLQPSHQSSTAAGAYVTEDDWEKEKAAYRQEKDARKEKSIDLEEDTTVRCPKCGSTSLSANKKGFGFGKAAAGLFVAVPVGLLAGGIGANNVEITCLSCGKKFKPGKK